LRQRFVHHCHEWKKAPAVTSPALGPERPRSGEALPAVTLDGGTGLPPATATLAGKKSRDAAYDRVTAVLGILRKQGRLDWSMVLDLTRELVEWQIIFASRREARAHLRRIYDEDRWLGQPHLTGLGRGAHQLRCAFPSRPYRPDPRAS